MDDEGKREYLVSFEADAVVWVAWDGDDEPDNDTMKQALQDDLGFTGITVTEVIYKSRA